MCVEKIFGMLKGRWRILLKMIDVHLKNVPKLVSICIVLHNICIILGDNFWKIEWLQEALDEVHNDLAFVTPQRHSSQEKFAVTNHALQELKGAPGKHWST